MGSNQSTLSPLIRGVEQLKVRSELHLARRFYHVLGVALILSIFHNVDRFTALTALSVAIILVVTVDFVRLRVPKVNNIVVSAFRPFLRKSEVTGISGMSWLLFGTLIIVFVFPRQVATLSLFLLAIGDPVSSVFGILYGKDKLVGNKSLQGSVAGFIACTVTAAVFFASRNIMVDRLILVSLLSGVIGALAELIPIGRSDDNFSFPVLSSIGLWVVFYLFGGFS